MTLSKFALAFAATSVLALGACDEMTDPNNPNRNTQQGAAIGAGLGALIGIATADSNADRRRGAVVGAVLGAGLGALGGAALDRQEAELRDTMGGNVGISNTGEQLIVTLPQDILFATDSSTLKGTMRGDLSALAASMNRYPNTTINVMGHTDNVGDAGYNQGLSARRAQAVTSVLINAGVAPSRIRSIGRGEDAPIAENFTAAGRQQNRRVEIIIVPN